jgi:hypothetical protein
MSRQANFPVLWLAVLLAANCALAQPGPPASDPRHVDATSFGQRITLGPNWLFAPGDSPAWASPTFDDSQWVTVSTQKQLYEYGFHDIPYAWYRLHIRLRPGTRNLMVGLDGVQGSYELYANGVRIGANGSFPSGYRFNQLNLAVYFVPDEIVTPNSELILAIRFALNATGPRGRGTSSPLGGAANSAVYLLSSESAGREAASFDSSRTTPFFILAGLSLLAGLVALALFGVLRSQHEYLAAAVHMFSWSAYYFLSVWVWNTASTFPSGLLFAFFFGLGNATLIEFVRLVLGLRRTRWIFALQIVYFLTAFSAPLVSTPFFPNYLGYAAYFLPMLFADLFVTGLLIRALLPHGQIRGYASRRLDAAVLLPAVVLITLGDYWTVFNYIAFVLHFTPTRQSLPTLHLGMYQFTLLTFGDFLSFTTVLLFLVLRTVGIASRHAKVAAELEAARTTQNLLLSRASQPTPGFHTESVYFPASEVGGDFFLISTSPAGSLIAIVGDVSGKGLTAAMRVAMILGVLRRETSWEPAEVLSNLNDALLTQAESGFTTACCVRLDKNGAYTVANAGHIAPCIDGAQIETPPALPLGIVPDRQYAVVTGTLAAAQRLVLLSDGVLEARSANGELFGFERTAALSRRDANQIARTAEQFGQEDDITVLTLERTVAA